MHAHDGLMLEGVPLNAVADALGTPVWVYGAGTLRRRLAALQGALAGLAEVHYAVKANDHLAVLRVLAAGGAGADVVSGGELRARAARRHPALAHRVLRRRQDAGRNPRRHWPPASPSSMSRVRPNST